MALGRKGLTMRGDQRVNCVQCFYVYYMELSLRDVLEFIPCFARKQNSAHPCRQDRGLPCLYRQSSVLSFSSPISGCRR
ncbi:unnamed protein product [Staurois parvus]|uniref:Uncharacterized protein n=1 Tax=Staurois parvus TaxID=386267 RepID=A0ABN9D6S4_9NEOB|nr:unnamed protein product [Staurois parvus]